MSSKSPFRIPQQSSNSLSSIPSQSVGHLLVHFALSFFMPLSATLLDCLLLSLVSSDLDLVLDLPLLFSSVSECECLTELVLFILLG